VETLRALGIPEDAIAQAVARGDPDGAIFDAVLMPAMKERTVTATEIERRGGLPAAETCAFVAAFGLRAPEPDEPAFTTDEADALVELGKLSDIWPTELDFRVGRVWGPLVARIAQSSIQLFRDNVEPQMRADDRDRLAALRAAHTALTRLLPVAELVLLGAYRRWIEHELAQAVAGEAERVGDELDLTGVVQVAFLFCDLKDFTAYADTCGDAAAVAAVDVFAETVARERGEDVRLMKSLGDGAMLVYSEPEAAAAAGARIITAMREADSLNAHAGVHYGPAIARDGDYFGGAVNLTARLLGTAGRDELVATRPVVERTSGVFDWEPSGAHRLRGVSEPVEIFRVRPVAQP
jgi:class 3 adenylate cyclase